jgi:hypothetical protein
VSFVTSDLQINILKADGKGFHAAPSICWLHHLVDGRNGWGGGWWRRRWQCWPRCPPSLCYHRQCINIILYWQPFLLSSLPPLLSLSPLLTLCLFSSLSPCCCPTGADGGWNTRGGEWGQRPVSSLPGAVAGW